MLHHHSLDAPLQVFWQGIVSVIHPAEIRIAARGRNLERIQHAGFRRLFQVRHVRVPGGLARPQAPDRLAVDHHIGDNVNFRIAFHEAAACFLHRRPVQRAKPLAESDQIFVGELLAAEQDDGMVVPCAVDRRKVRFGNRAQIYSVYLRTDRFPAQQNLDGGLRSCRGMHRNQFIR